MTDVDSRKLDVVISADTEHLRETLVARRLIADGRLLKIYEDEIRYPSGRNGTRAVVEHPGAVCIVPITADQGIVLVRQWRHAAGRAFWELPAGTRDGAEDPRRCAERELSEETGYTAATWRDLGRVDAAPGYSTEVMFFWEARDLAPGPIHPDQDEVLDVADFSLAELAALRAAGDLDMKSLAGLLLAGFSLNV